MNNTTKKNKTLVILLIIPFVIAILTFVSVIVVKRTVKADITDIKWDYNQNEGFKLVLDAEYELQAERVYNENVELAEGNELTWSTKKINESDAEVAKVIERQEKFYLVPLAEGECEVICSNVRGTKSKYFKAIIYENGTIIINPKNKVSGENIDKNLYFGEYDIVSNTSILERKEATFKVDTQVLGGYDGITQAIGLKESSSNIKFDDNVITIVGDGDAYFTLFSIDSPSLNNSFEFKIVDNGYNIYSYNDLLKVSNKSSNGQRIVMQTNLESLDNLYKKEYLNKEETKWIFKDELLDPLANKSLFGNFNFDDQSFSFDEELIEIRTTYDDTYVNTFNETIKDSNFEPNIKIGLNIQQDFYGNGYTINMHNLAFPRIGEQEGDVNSKSILAPHKATKDNEKGDYFFGPLPYLTIGTLNSPIVKAFGQDNIGLYINGDNIILNDVKLRNTNETSDMNQLIYVGTVVEVAGNNNTIKNSILSNGRTIVRAFSSDGLTIDNSILKTSGEFNLKVGSNKISKNGKSDTNTYNTNKNVRITSGGNNINKKFDYFFNTDDTVKDNANYFLNNFVKGSNVNIDVLKEIQAGLDNTEGIINQDGSVNFASKITVNDTSFYNSGIFSIAFDTMFNGAYLYGGLPTYVSDNVSALGDNLVLPNKVGGTSYPVKLTLSGETKFYDWKDMSKVNINNLIEENISQLVEEETAIDLDSFFPMRSVLNDYAKENKLLYNDTYINSSVAWYGGGYNLSELENLIPQELSANTFIEEIDVDVLKALMNEKYTPTNNILKILSRCVIMASGTHSFKFVTNDASEVENGKIPSLFNKAPQIDEFKNRG